MYDKLIIDDLIFFVDRSNRPRLPEIKDWTVEENTQRLYSTSTISLFSETNTINQLFSKETPLQNSETNTNYLLAGAGAIIFMLLFIIVKQTSRKSKSDKRTSLVQHKSNEIQTCDETFNRPPNRQGRKYFTVASYKQSNHFYQHMDPVYHEIDESMEMTQIPASTGTANEFKDQNLLRCLNNSISDVDLNTQSSKSYVLPITGSKCPYADETGYLQSAFTHANIEIESKRETHSYIDVIG